MIWALILQYLIIKTIIKETNYSVHNNNNNNNNNNNEVENFLPKFQREVNMKNIWNKSKFQGEKNGKEQGELPRASGFMARPK